MGLSVGVYAKVRTAGGWVETDKTAEFSAPSV